MVLHNEKLAQAINKQHMVTGQTIKQKWHTIIQSGFGGDCIELTSYRKQEVEDIFYQHIICSLSYVLQGKICIILIIQPQWVKNTEYW